MGNDYLNIEIKNSLKKIEELIEEDEERSKINEEKRKLDLLLNEYYDNMN